jgi:hypothetical protein
LKNATTHREPLAVSVTVAAVKQDRHSVWERSDIAFGNASTVLHTLAHKSLSWTGNHRKSMEQLAFLSEAKGRDGRCVRA